VGELLLWALREPLSADDMPPLRPSIAPRLIEAAARHGVSALLHDALATAGALGHLGRSQHEVLSRQRAHVAAQHLRVSTDLAALARALDAAGIAWAVMKGPAVAALGYQFPTARWFADLDVLVGASDFGRAIDVLCEEGACLVDVNWDLQLEMQRSEATLALAFGTALDLHWHPVNDRAARATTRLDVAAVLSRRRLIAASTVTDLPVLGPTDNMLLVALHAAVSGGHRLTWMKDLECLCLRDPPDWDLLVRRASAAQVGLPVGLMLRRAARLLGAKVPPNALSSLVGDRPWARLAARGERLATPVSLGRCSRTGMGIVSSLRGSPAASAAALAKTQCQHLTSTVLAQRDRVERDNGKDCMAAPARNPLWSPAGGPASRARYLATIKTSTR